MAIAEITGAAEGTRFESLTVCLVTEGSYPHTKGGVSTWCDMLVRGLPEVRFVLLSLVASPSVRPVYARSPVGRAGRRRRPTAR